jgi:hypothetical protein
MSFFSSKNGEQEGKTVLSGSWYQWRRGEEIEGKGEGE